mmetsp:Transcript_4145/g.7138  ORF Transcript_4145/g.7138 Transcript_4145/m.7138 type:complete len:93 (+) Transcript_4145:494-772(+)
MEEIPSVKLKSLRLELGQQLLQRQQQQQREGEDDAYSMGLLKAFRQNTSLIDIHLVGSAWPREVSFLSSRNIYFPIVSSLGCHGPDALWPFV